MGIMDTHPSADFHVMVSLKPYLQTISCGCQSHGSSLRAGRRYQLFIESWQEITVFSGDVADDIGLAIALHVCPIAILGRWGSHIWSVQRGLVTLVLILGSVVEEQNLAA